MKDVVDVGGDDQSLDGQAHLRRDIAREHVAEVAGRHAEGDLAVRRAELKRGGEVIDDLGHEPSPVDRVDRADAEAPGHGRIVEHPLHHRLGVVEAAFDGDVVDVGRLDRGHLPALHVAHPALRVEHEDVDVLAPRHRVDRRGAGVAAGGPDDRQPLVSAREELLE